MMPLNCIYTYLHEIYEKQLRFWENLSTYFSTSLPTFIITDRFWLFYSNLISLFFIIIFIILIGILLTNNAKHVKFLNLLSAFYLIIYFFLTSLNYSYDFFNLNLSFNQNTTLFVNLFIFISTLTVLIFFLGISNVFFIEENNKIEFSFLVWFIYISAIYLISSTDFIAIIILLECIAFSSYVLVGFDRKNKFSTTSALKYLIIASIPSGIFILGIALLYYNFGSFSQDYLILLLNGLSLNIFEINSELFISFVKNLSNSYFLDMTYFQKYSGIINPLVIENWYFNIFFKPFVDYMFYLNELCNIINIRSYSDALIAEQLYVAMDTALPFTKINGTTNADFATFLDKHWELDEAERTLKVSQVKAFYKSQLVQIVFLVKELYFFRFFWELFGNENWAFITNNVISFNFSDPQTFKFLADNNLTGILNWFSLFSGCEVLRIDAIFPWDQYGGAIKSIWLGLNGTVEFQKLNIEKLQAFISTAPICNLDVAVTRNVAGLWHQMLFDHLKKIFFSYAYFANPSNEVLATLLNIISKNVFFATAFLNNNISYVNYFETLDNIFNQVNHDALFNWYFSQLNELIYYNNTFIYLYLVIIFIFMNLAFKLTAAPFHVWAPSVYGGSPLATLTFLSIFSKLTIIFFTIWLFLNVFDNLKDIWQPIFFVIALLSVIFSILGAFSEKIFKRFFIYSSVGHVGFMLVGISVLNLDGIKGTVDYLILYILSSYLIWFILMHLTKKTATLVNLKGLSFNQPYLSLIFSITIFSLSGIPPFGGFFVKYEIFYSMINSSFFYFAYILLILTVISFFYYLRLIKIIFFENNKIFTKNKNLEDIKLRIVATGFFIIPLFMLFFENPLAYLINEILYKALI